jgi:hypothetical protein
MRNPVETKVVAATAGSGVGAVVGTFAIWLLGVTVWNQSNASDNASAAIAAVPAPVQGIVLLGISTILAFLSGLLAPHTPRLTGYRLSPVVTPGEVQRDADAT